jgi:hypothetical protein
MGSLPKQEHRPLGRLPGLQTGRQGRDDAWPLGRDPDRREPGYQFREALAARLRQVHQDRGVEHHHRDVGGGIGHHGPDQLQQVTAEHLRRIAPGDPHGGLEPGEPLRLVGPDAALQPADGVVVVKVDGARLMPRRHTTSGSVVGIGTGPWGWQASRSGAAGSPTIVPP